MKKIMSGIEFAENKKKELASTVGLLNHKGISPELLVVQVGNDPASDVYVKQKVNFGKEIGVVVKHVKFGESTTTNELVYFISRITIPVIVQLPLPSHIDTRAVLDSVNHTIDVDGFTTKNMGLLMTGQEGLQPCTPKGIMEILEYYGHDLEGKHAVVVGRSDIVGKPVSMMLLQKNCTVTVCHSKTKNLKDFTSQADILVVAMGKPEFITSEYVKEGAVVVDVGIHRTESGKIVGDVMFDDVVSKVEAITPVPKGIGRCTVAMLFSNVVESYLKTVTQ